MNRFSQIIIAGALASGFPGAALAQGAQSPHQGHGQAPAATPHPQHQGQGHQQPGGHQQNCQCACCRMMMEMMQRHGMHQSGTAPSPPNEHQSHEDERPD